MMLKDYLIVNKIPQCSFAKRIGISRQVLSKYLINPKKAPYIVKLVVEYITAGEVSRYEWKYNVKT